MDGRLKKLIDKGHGHCLEAVMLEPDQTKRIAKLEEYIRRLEEDDYEERRPWGRQLDRARALLKRERSHE